MWLSGSIIGEKALKMRMAQPLQSMETYRIALTNFFVSALWMVWFQQDSATCYTSHSAIDLLRQTFDGLLISLNGDVILPPIGCALTLLDYFFVGYADKPNSIEHLKAFMHDAIAEIRPHTLEMCIRIGPIEKGIVGPTAAVMRMKLNPFLTGIILLLNKENKFGKISNRFCFIVL